MVILKNIKKTNNDISADYYPEGKEPKGFMRVRISDNEVLEHKNVSSFAAVHVKRELSRLSKLENPPSEKTVIWY